MIGIRLIAAQQNDDDDHDGKLFEIDYEYDNSRSGDVDEEMLTAIARHIVRRAIDYAQAAKDEMDGEEPGVFMRTFTLEVKIP